MHLKRPSGPTNLNLTYLLYLTSEFLLVVVTGRMGQLAMLNQMIASLFSYIFGMAVVLLCISDLTNDASKVGNLVSSTFALTEIQNGFFYYLGILKWRSFGVYCFLAGLWMSPKLLTQVTSLAKQKNGYVETNVYNSQLNVNVDRILQVCCLIRCAVILNHASNMTITPYVLMV